MEDILHQLIGSLSHSLQGFMHPRWCRISSINSINWLPSVKGNWNPPSFNRRWHLRKVNTFCWPILVDIFWVPPGFKKPRKIRHGNPTKIGGLFLYRCFSFSFPGCIFQVNQPLVEPARLRWMRSFPNPPRNMSWRMTSFFFHGKCTAAHFFGRWYFECPYTYIYIFSFLIHRNYWGVLCLKWSNWLILQSRNITLIHSHIFFLVVWRKKLPGNTDMTWLQHTFLFLE